MKNRITIGIFLLIHITSIHACDICGCSISGFSSVLPLFQKNFAGIRYSSGRYEARHLHEEGNISKESSVTTEFYGRYYLAERVQAFWSLPWNVKTRKEPGQSFKTSGFGDVILGLNYTLLNRNRDSFRLKHLWLAGAGVKLPTGSTGLHHQDELPGLALQPGTGSFDCLFSSMYTIRYRRIGLSTDVQYRMNNQNKEFYAFGNRFGTSSRLFFWKKAGKNCNILPGTGVLIEKTGKDYENGYEVTESGGQLLAVSGGLEGYYKKGMLSINFIVPVSQNLSLGYIKAYPRLQISGGLMF